MSDDRPMPWDDVDVPEDEEGNPVAAKDMLHADKLLGKLRWLERKRFNINQLAEARINEVKDWRDSETASIDKEADRIKASLESFARFAITGKTKTLKLPNGELSLRAPGQAKFAIDGAEAIVAKWLEDHDHVKLLRYKPELQKDEIKKKIASGELKTRDLSAEIVDGVTYTAKGVLVRIVDPEAGEMEAQIPGVKILKRKEDKFTATPLGLFPTEERGD